jgi:hypothetical protein
MSESSRDGRAQRKPASPNRVGPNIRPLKDLTLEAEVRQLRINYEFMVTYFKQQIHLKRAERAKLQQKLDQRLAQLR